MVLFIVLWRQAEKKADQNFKTYDELRQRIIGAAQGRKSVSTKELTKHIHDVQYGTQDFDQPENNEANTQQEPHYESEQFSESYIDPVADNYSNEEAQETLEQTPDFYGDKGTNVTPAEHVSYEQTDEVEQVTPEQIEANKERTTLRNLNIMLYMASFLLVAAAAAFVAAAMPEIIRLIGLLVVVVMFYVAGIVLYQRAPRFKPAAIAFVGTGLAILPFVGIALTLLGGVSAESAWLSTSVVGVIAYLYAGAVLKSQVISYISMAFVLSTVSAAVSSVSLPIVWHFISLIGVSLLASTISYYRPEALPQVFKKPIETTGQIVTPTALIASLFVTQAMSIQMYELLFGVSALHYLVVFLQRRSLFYETIVRLLGHTTLLIVTWDITNMPTYDWSMFGIWWVGLAVCQAVYSLLNIARSTDDKRLSVERVWLVVIHVGLVISLGFWLRNDAQELFIACNLALLGAVSLVSAYTTKNALWGYISLFTSVTLPFVVGRGVADPQWPYIVLVLAFTVLATMAVLAYWKVRTRRSRSVLRLLANTIVFYIIAIIVSGSLDGQSVVYGMAMLLAGMVATTYSYASQNSKIEFIGAPLAAYGMGTIAATLVSGGSWKLYAGFVVATLMLGGVALAHQLIDKSAVRRDGLVVLTLVVFAVFALLSPILDELVHILTALLTLAILMSLVGLRWLAGRDQPSNLRTILMVGYISYLVLGWYGTLELSIGWGLLYYVVATGVLWLSSRLERRPSILLLGNITLVIACVRICQWLDLDPTWIALLASVLAGSVFTAAYSIYVTFHDEARQWLMAGSAWLVLVIGAYVGYGDTVGHYIFSVAMLLCSFALVVTQRLIGYTSTKSTSLFTNALAGASLLYLIVGTAYVFTDALLAAWVYSLGALATTWLSYRMPSRFIEIFGASQLAIAVWFLTGELQLGDWHLTVAIIASIILFAIGMIVYHSRSEPSRRNSLLMVAILLACLFVLNFPLTDSGIAQLSMVLLGIVAVANCVARIATDKFHDQEIHAITAFGYSIPALLAWVMSFAIGDGWIVGASFVAAAVFWVSSHYEKQWFLLLLSYLFVFVMFSRLWSGLQLSADWSLFGVTTAAAAVYYFAYWMYIRRGDSQRSVISLVATVFSLIIIPFIYGGYSYTDELRLISIYCSLIGGAVATAVHGLMNKNYSLTEVAVYVLTFGMQRIIDILIPGIDAVWYAHWWAAVIALVAYWRPTYKTARFTIAMSLVTAVVGIMALTEGGVYQLLFLVEHIALLVTGALRRKQWAVWWGLVASVAAIMYFIKDYTYLWLGLLGLALIGLVVWRLSKLGNSQKNQ